MNLVADKGALILQTPILPLLRLQAECEYNCPSFLFSKKILIISSFQPCTCNAPRAPSLFSPHLPEPSPDQARSLVEDYHTVKIKEALNRNVAAVQITK